MSTLDSEEVRVGVRRWSFRRRKEGCWIGGPCKGLLPCGTEEIGF